MARKKTQWLLAAAILTGLAVFDLAYFGPWRGEMAEKKQLLRDVDAADELSTALGTAVADHRRDLFQGVAYPAESGAHTTPQYLALLVKAGYLEKENLPTYRDLVVGNVSQRDTADTVLLVSRGVYDKMILHRGDARRYVLFLKSGVSQMAMELPPKERIPPRNPAFLPP